MIKLTGKITLSRATTGQRILPNSGQMASFARVAVITALAVAVWQPSYAIAQARPGFDLEGSVGWAGFPDNSINHHGVLGGGTRFYFTPRLALGPEVVYMRGPGTDRDFMLTGNLTFDFLRSGTTGPPRLNPYLVASGGLFQHRDGLRGGTFTSNEGAFTLGGGLRVFLTDKFYIAPEVRVGWELHFRSTLAVGFRF